MKKNILVILIVIGVVGVVAYLLKDKLKALLGERVEGEEAPGIPNGPYSWALPQKIGLAGLLKDPTGYFDRPGITMGVGITLPGESPARWLREEIAPILQPLYPAQYIAIMKGLLAYLTMGEGEVTKAQEIISKGQEGTHPYPPGDPRYGPTNGPYSWALPQF